MEGYGNENPGAFQPTRPLRGATKSQQKPRKAFLFQPTRPLRGATGILAIGFVHNSYFNPRAPCGARQLIVAVSTILTTFQPTRPLRGATTCIDGLPFTSVISTHAPLAGRDPPEPPEDTPEIISTHAPLAGRDFRFLHELNDTDISTHAPLAGRDYVTHIRNRSRRNFNPRAPCGARQTAQADLQPEQNFNPRAPCGARPRPKRPKPPRAYFNPRAPCGARLIGSRIRVQHTKFQPTRPLRGATCTETNSFPSAIISTHAPLAGRDARHSSGFMIENISTHAPLAGRDRVIAKHGRKSVKFQPTRPLRGATNKRLQINIRHSNFNPRAPCGARPMTEAAQSPIVISTHAPLAGRDSKSVQITMHIFAITDKFQMLLHRMPPVRAFCSFLMQENHADFGCEPPK